MTAAQLAPVPGPAGLVVEGAVRPPVPLALLIPVPARDRHGFPCAEAARELTPGTCVCLPLRRWPGRWSCCRRQCRAPWSAMLRAEPGRLPRMQQIPGRRYTPDGQADLRRCTRAVMPVHDGAEAPPAHRCHRCHGQARRIHCRPGSCTGQVRHERSGGSRSALLRIPCGACEGVGGNPSWVAGAPSQVKLCRKYVKAPDATNAGRRFPDPKGVPELLHGNLAEVS